MRNHVAALRPVSYIAVSSGLLPTLYSNIILRRDAAVGAASYIWSTLKLDVCTMIVYEKAAQVITRVLKPQWNFKHEGCTYTRTNKRVIWAWRGLHEYCSDVSRFSIKITFTLFALYVMIILLHQERVPHSKQPQCASGIRRWRIRISVCVYSKTARRWFVKMSAVSPKLNWMVNYSLDLDTWSPERGCGCTLNGAPLTWQCSAENGNLTVGFRDTKDAHNSEQIMRVIESGFEHSAQHRGTQHPLL